MARATPSEETIALICEQVSAGVSIGAIGAATGMTRNAVSGIVFRLRQAGDPRLPPAGACIIMTKAQQRDALADAFAAGAPTLAVAAGIAGVGPASLRWAEVRAALGWQAV